MSRKKRTVRELAEVREDHREVKRRASDGDNSSQTKRIALAAVVSVLAVVYLLWFLSFPVLAGLNGDDGMAISRGQFLTRVLLPELWWGEVTGAGQMPLGVLDRLPIGLGALGWLGVAIAIGRVVVRRAFTELTRVEAITLSTLAGLAMLSTLVLLVGLAGGSNSRWIIVLAVLLALAVAWIVDSRALFNCERLQVHLLPANQLSWLPEGIVAAGVFGQLASRAVLVLTIVLAVIYGLGVMMPPYEFDVVEYHLQGAKEFFQSGSIGFNDHNIYLNMPLGLEMHSLAAMSLVNGSDGWWLGGLIGKAVIGAHALLAAGLVGGFVARKTNSWWCGWSVTGLWLAVPGNAHVATTGLIDAAMGAYVLASVIALTELFEASTAASIVASVVADDRRSDRSAWLVFAIFVFAGAAAAAKYPGLIYGVLPALVAVGWMAVRRLRESRGNEDLERLSTGGLNASGFVWPWLGAVIGGLLLTCVPWYAKNAVLASNPIYPLGYAWFGGVGLNASRAEQWSQAHRVPIDGQSGSAYSLSALDGSVKNLVVASEFVQPSLIILLVCGVVACGFIAAGRRGWASAGRLSSTASCLWMWVGWSMWIVLVWWLVTHRIDRFWLPAVSLWAVIAGVGLVWLSRQASQTLATVLVLAGLMYGVVVNSSPAIGDNRFFVSLEALRADGGDGERVGRLSRSIAWCNANLSFTESKLLLVGEARAFDFRMPIVYSTCFDVSPAEKWLRGVGSEGDDLRDGLQNRDTRANLLGAGITHVLVNWSELARYRSPGNYGFSDWPTRDDLARLVEAGWLRRVSWPIESETADLYEVVLN